MDGNSSKVVAFEASTISPIIASVSLLILVALLFVITFGFVTSVTGQSIPGV